MKIIKIIRIIKIIKIIETLWSDEQTSARRHTHEVHGSEAAVADLSEVSEHLLRIIFAEEVRHVWVFQVSRPSTRGHGQGLRKVRGQRREKKQGQDSRPPCRRCEARARSGAVFNKSTFLHLPLSQTGIIFTGTEKMYQLINHSINKHSKVIDCDY